MVSIDSRVTVKANSLVNCASTISTNVRPATKPTGVSLAMEFAAILMVATTALACLGTLVMRVNELLAAVTTCRVGMGAPVVNLLSGRLASALQAGQEPIVPTTYAPYPMEHAQMVELAGPMVNRLTACALAAMRARVVKWTSMNADLSINVGREHARIRMDRINVRVLLDTQGLTVQLTLMTAVKILASVLLGGHATTQVVASSAPV